MRREEFGVAVPGSVKDYGIEVVVDSRCPPGTCYFVNAWEPSEAYCVIGRLEDLKMVPSAYESTKLKLPTGL